MARSSSSERHDSVEAVLSRKSGQFVGEGIGLAVGILEPGQTYTYGYGQMRGGKARTPDARTLYEIGSISKVFTASLLAAMVVENAVELQQPVVELVPDAPGLPRSITLLSLATHTSGLPRLPDNLWTSRQKDPRDPYANYHESDLLDYLRTVRTRDLEETAGTIRYSNLGMGLLGYSLSRRLGLCYEAATRQWVCRPVGLDDTVLTLSPDQRGRLAEPHDGAGQPTTGFHLPSLAGAGALHSTIADVLCFLSAHVMEDSPLDDIPRLTTPVRYTRFARPPALLRLLAGCRKVFPLHGRPAPHLLGVGLGWMQLRLPKSGAMAWAHNGGTAGYRTFAAFASHSETGVAVLNNRGARQRDVIWPGYDVDALGIDLLDTLNV